MSLLDALLERIADSWPGLELSTDRGERSISIPSGNEAIGTLSLFDDEEEVSVYVGNFTHWHATSDDSLVGTNQGKDQVVDRVMEFIEDLFADKIVMWGRQDAVGGFYHVDYPLSEQDAPLVGESVTRVLWSGKSVD